MVGEGGHRLTVTQAQQLALARLVFADPSVAILDEATTEAGSADVEGRPVSGADLLAWALDQDVELVVITGGEPLLQQRRLVPLVTGLVAGGRRVEIETNGTIAPLPELVGVVDQFNVSPKLTRC